jgi:plasmid stability protein
MQYTLRDLPPLLDSELRRRAKAEGKSLNAVAIEALTRGVGFGDMAPPQRDLSDIAGTWQEDPAFDEAIADQDRIDENLWR